MRFAVFVFLAACARPMAPPPVTVELEAVAHEEGVSPAFPEREQPPDVKLRLGHFFSARTGIGLVIDRTGDKGARVRFDGTAQVLALFPQYFWHRTEYHRAEGKLLELRNNGAVVLFFDGHEIYLYRDGDADPL